MKINTIFEIINKALLSVRWEHECEDRFEQCFNLWRDIEHLEKFFEQYKSDLRSNFWQLTVEYAVLKAVKEASEFEADILNCAIRGTLDGIIFKSLKGSKEIEFRRVQSKAYGVAEGSESSMLRIYAIRLGSNCYIVTGGAIKLTKAMQERPHTALELKKLEYISAFLKTNGIDDESDYGFIEIEIK